MKIKLFLFSMLGLIIIFSCQSQPKALKFVTLQYPPYEYLENDTLKGIAVDLVKEVFQRMNQPVDIELLLWDEALEKIKKGTADGIFTIYKTPDREEYTNFSAEILIPQIVSLFVLQDSNINFNGDLSELGDHRFGIVNEVSYGSMMDQAIDEGIINNLERFDTGEENMEALLNGDIEILVSNKYGAHFIIQNLGKKDLVKELEPQLQNVPSYVGFSKNKDLEKIRSRFDENIKKIKEDGTYKKIFNVYLTDM